MVEQGNFGLHQPNALDAVFHALADSTRRAILRDVIRSEKTVGEIAEPYAMSLAAVSKHLDVLERASLIQRERKGTSRLVRLNPKPLAAAHEWLAFYENFWKSNLDRLQDFLEKEQAGPTDLARATSHAKPSPKKEK
ncbi:MAG: metalloregulator ArsR/SmtB family transcription factor [Acidobacteriota bacterium]|nr:metalloregulator ArsR/SmtB family transcription factor [Acidobacteriota bacterium]